ncbi:MAG: 1-acyl-sn-glycerol-3-phosphate acyltransferase, partial [Clostridia bacterium]|nr:1-acyl-sn-glycerol-3-phosphate acyltransferase [Clostridia bacterium]
VRGSIQNYNTTLLIKKAKKEKALANMEGNAPHLHPLVFIPACAAAKFVIKCCCTEPEGGRSYMDARKRHIFLWKLTRPFASAAAVLLFRYKAPVCRETGPFLLLANHNADLDPLFIAYSFPETIYFVASEHLLRAGRVSDFLRWATELIPRQKGGFGAGTVRSI